MPSTSPRARRIALAVCGLAAALLAVYLSIWSNVTAAQRADSDFSATWVAAQVWRDGQGARLYDQGLETARHLPLFPPGALTAGQQPDLPFITPPATAVLAAPLTLLDLTTAYRLWSLLQLALLAAAIAVALRAAPWPPRAPAWLRAAAGLGALAGAGSLRLLLQGQWDGLSALSLALAYWAWRRDRPGWAGALLAGGALLAKPHLAIGVAVWLVAQRNRRAVAGAAAGAAAVAGASVLLAGPAAAAGWVRALTSYGSAGHASLASLSGLTGLLGSWIASAAAAQGLAALGSVVALAACWRLGDQARRRPQLLEPSLAGATALSLLAAPHLLIHDLVLLAPALAWTVAWAAGRGGRALRTVALGWVALDLAALIDWGRASVGPPGRLVPLVLIALGVLAAGACGLRLPRRGHSRTVAAPAGG
jgi:hypothetical protein